jgi:hypothetical protein
MRPMIPKRLTASPSITTINRPFTLDAIPRLNKLITKPKTVTAIPANITLVPLFYCNFQRNRETVDAVLSGTGLKLERSAIWLADYFSLQFHSLPIENPNGLYTFFLFDEAMAPPERTNLKIYLALVQQSRTIKFSFFS